MQVYEGQRQLKGFSGSTYASLLGFELVCYGYGKAEVSMGVERELLNSSGKLHGGVLCSLTNSIASKAVRSTFATSETASTLELKLNFIKSVMGGIVTAEANVVHRGRNTVVSNIDITDQEGERVAYGTATHFLSSLAPHV